MRPSGLQASTPQFYELIAAAEVAQELETLVPKIKHKTRRVQPTHLRIEGKADYLRLAPLEVYNSSGMVRIVARYSGRSSLFCHRRSLPGYSRSS